MSGRTSSLREATSRIARSHVTGWRRNAPRMATSFTTAADGSKVAGGETDQHDLPARTDEVDGVTVPGPPLASNTTSTP